MIFENKQLNRILNALLNNNKNAKHYFMFFINQLPEEALSLLYDCQNIEYDGDNWTVKSYFSQSPIEIEIYYNNQALKLVFTPIAHSQLSEIPLDNENDIFLNDENVDIDSPAFFEIIFNPNVDEIDELDEENYGYFLVKKQEKGGNVGYYLVSQALNDAGIHSSKVDIEDFIMDPEECEFQVARKVKNSTNPPSNTKTLPHSHSLRRASNPRKPHPSF